jgi:hypothetical protein
MANTPGWLGPHNNSEVFHNRAKGDLLMPCHMTVNKEHPEVSDRTAHQCAGQALYMTADFKRSRDKGMAAYQDHLRGVDKTKLLFSRDGSKLREFHGK